MLMDLLRGLATFAAVLAALSAPAANAQALLGNDFNGILYDVDAATGAASNPRSTGTGIDSLMGITFAPDGTLFGLTTFAGTPANALVAIDPATGTSTTVGVTGLALAEGDLAFDPTSGMLYGLNNLIDERELFTIDVVTGVGTPVGDVAPLYTADFSAMTFAPDGTLYLLDTGQTDPSRLLVVNKLTAAIISSVTLSVDLGFLAGMDFHPTTGALYVADGSLGGTNSLYTLNPNTGVMTLIGSTGLREGLAGLAFAIPEPTGAALATLAGLIALAMRRCSTSARPIGMA
jgi:DNA-binding beta-propeller fold protein YncE